ncbi:MAG: HNH endonuclease [Nitrospiraceae bacterium]|nr:MAG: HNH endonuclease [Nitrospiraceae bacterium]
MQVFVLDQRKQPLMPCPPARARELLRCGRATVYRRYPFTIRLTGRRDGDVQPLRLKLDPGSHMTGVALVREEGKNQHVLFLAEITHRGQQIRQALLKRRAFRRRRRHANLRYRAKRFDNRMRHEGWLPPSLQHRVDTVLSWVDRLRRLSPLVSISTELVRFDMQQIENPEVAGMEYQQGELAGYEVREYLLEKWGRACAYCGVENTPLQVEHIHPRVRGGSDRVSNLTLACEPCNTRKGAMPVEAFLAKKPEALARILAQAKRPLKDAAAVNATRWALFHTLKATGLPVEVASGGRTKWNRTRLGIPKTHALDAACVGAVEAITGWQRPMLAIKATGRGSYQRTRLDKYGFPRGYLTRSKRVHGFQTGDLVVATVTAGKKAGVHVGRVAIRATGRFNIQTAQGLIQGLSYRVCCLLQRADGYGYVLLAHTRKESENWGRAVHAALPLPGLNPKVSRAN